MAEIKKKDIAKIVHERNDASAYRDVTVTRVDDEEAGNECYVVKTATPNATALPATISCVPSLAKLKAAAVTGGRTARYSSDDSEESMEVQRTQKRQKNILK